MMRTRIRLVKGKFVETPFTDEENAQADADAALPITPRPLRDPLAELDALKAALIESGVLTGATASKKN